MEQCFLFLLSDVEFCGEVTGQRLDSKLVEVAKHTERKNLWGWPVFIRIAKAEAKQRVSALSGDL